MDTRKHLSKGKLIIVAFANGRHLSNNS